MATTHPYGTTTYYAGVGSLARSGAFDERSVLSDLIDDRYWDAWESRLQRYELLWAAYENTAYSRQRLWSSQFRRAYEMYAHVRSLTGVPTRLGEFYANHLMPGPLDFAGGDGKVVPSALPIVLPADAGADGEALRLAIGRLWRDSNWQVHKTVLSRTGAVLGDVALKVVDDPYRKKPYLCVVPPTSIRWLERDGLGNVRGYILEELRPDPRFDGPTEWAPRVTFREECRKSDDGLAVRFATFLDDQSWDWRVYPDGPHPDREPDWTAPYEFVPMVAIQHVGVGLCWGWAECHPLLSRVRELDDLLSIIADQARKKLNNPMAANIAMPSTRTDNKARPAQSEFDAQQQSTIPGRDTQSIKYYGREGGAPIDLKLMPLAGDLSLADSDAHAKALLDAIYREYPELVVDLGDAAGDASGRSYRIRRQAAEAKVYERRFGYFDALVRAHKMALSIGSGRGYPGYEGLGKADDYSRSFEDGLFEHSIGKSAVFAVDPLDDAELMLAQGNGGVAWLTAGLPMEIYLENLGWAPEKVARAVALARADEERKAKLQQAGQLAIAQARLAGQGTGGNAPKPREMSINPPNRLDGPSRANGNPKALPNGVNRG